MDLRITLYNFPGQSTFECSAEACSVESRQQTPLIIQHSLFGRKENCKILGKELHHLTRRRVILPDARNHGDRWDQTQA